MPDDRRQPWGTRALAVALGAAVTVAAPSCSSDGSDQDDQPKLATRETMLDSAFCGGCHREQYDEWAGSMHAYAADDPIFRALNEALQREVGDEQKGFCLKCHAPMAEHVGATLDLAALDARPALKGVTCFFCHDALGTTGDFNNPIRLDGANVMGGELRDPIDPVVHRAEYRNVLDGRSDSQPALCGPCHDIVAIGGAHVERTFLEWRRSHFADDSFKSCAECHMAPREGRAAIVEGSPPRTIHDHSMVGVDVALTPFPGREDQRAKIQASLDDAIDAELCVEAAPSGATIDVALTNHRVGHSWPSGATQDRRAWLEVTAFKGAEVVFESGHVKDDAAVRDLDDPNLFLLRQHAFDKDGAETELFWRTTSVESKELPPVPGQASTDPPPLPTLHATYAVPAMPDRATIVLKIRPIDYDLVRELTTMGDLAPNVVTSIETFSLAKTRLEWKAGGERCVR